MFPLFPCTLSLSLSLQEYSTERLQDYLAHKENMLAQIEARSVTGLKRVHEY